MSAGSVSKKTCIQHMFHTKECDRERCNSLWLGNDFAIDIWLDCLATAEAHADKNIIDAKIVNRALQSK